MQATDLPLINTLTAPSVHPDGDRAVVGVIRPDLDADAYVGQLWIVPLRDGEPPRRLTRGFRDTAPRFSPDGRLVAFLRAEPSAPPQIFVMAADGGEAVQVTDRKLGVGAFRWTPDSAQLLFTSREPEAGRYGSVDDIAPGAEPPRRITTYTYTANGLGYFRDRPQHLFAVAAPDVYAEPVVQPVPTAEGKADPREIVAQPRQITTDDIDHLGFEILPDGATVAVIAARHDGADEDLRNGVYLYRLDGNGDGDDDGETRTVIEPDENLWAQQVVAGTDDRLYVVAIDVGEDGRDFVARQDALYVVEAGQLRRLTDPALVHVSGPVIPVSDGVLVTLQDRGTQPLAHVGNDGDVRVLTTEPVMIEAGDAAGGSLALVYRDAGTYGDLAAASLDDVTAGGAISVAELSRPTDFSAALRDAGVIEPSELTVTGRDGYPVHGWVAVPDGDGPHPTLLMIHGGPFAAYNVSLFDETQVLVDAGYAVVYCNPRGSSGYGAEHGRAIRHTMGTVDFHDVLDFLDGAVASDSRLDGSRTGVLGGSYGGYLTAWTIAHDHRFAGAIVERGYLDPEMFFGTSDIGSFFSDEYVGTDPEMVAGQSPQAVASQVKTPTLVLHSEVDLRCPLSQAERYFATLKRNGVETEMVIFPGENHELSRSGRPRHRQQRFEVILDWWRKHLPVDVGE
jgi:dipeptidyl aminopeptidase/acylaminoacyl peptidase